MVTSRWIFRCGGCLKISLSGRWLLLGHSPNVVANSRSIFRLMVTARQQQFVALTWRWVFQCNGHFQITWLLFVWWLLVVLLIDPFSVWCLILYHFSVSWMLEDQSFIVLVTWRSIFKFDRTKRTPICVCKRAKLPNNCALTMMTYQQVSARLRDWP